VHSKYPPRAVERGYRLRKRSEEGATTHVRGAPKKKTIYRAASIKKQLTDTATTLVKSRPIDAQNPCMGKKRSKVSGLRQRRKKEEGSRTVLTKSGVKTDAADRANEHATQRNRNPTTEKTRRKKKRGAGSEKERTRLLIRHTRARTRSYAHWLALDGRDPKGAVASCRGGKKKCSASCVDLKGGSVA